MFVATTGHTTTPSFLETLTISRHKSSFTSTFDTCRNNKQQYQGRAYLGRRVYTTYLSLPVPELATRRPEREMKLSPFQFSKYQGLGNDFVIVDHRHQSHPALATEHVKFVCDRRFGVGADGVIFLLPPKESTNDAQMRILNSDGSEPEMCGNGIRCLAKYMRDISSEWRSKRILRIETPAGVMFVEFVAEDGIKVDMGKPILDPSAVPTTLKPDAGEESAAVDIPIHIEDRTFRVTCVSMGNPHCIILVDNLEEIEATLDYWGPRIEKAKWFPKRTNVEFVKVVDQNQIKVIVWERGVGRTLACGTGACASVVAAKLLGGAVGEQEVVLPGGKLRCHWDSDEHVYMTGPAEKVFEGHFVG
ncbi:hypothetical protein GpartN1_g1245.t1 [Galdieria partita]|uniref:diaminopimelate epimerase n=1 Tax=Galdieria partita TaxID=83374 RepID=A0A9C7PSI1_9RHOD|nr:hypothetical protein GpartN1_g1245.t1 [Galdieria partita]